MKLEKLVIFSFLKKLAVSPEDCWHPGQWLGWMCHSVRAWCDECYGRCLSEEQGTAQLVTSLV